MLYLAKVQKSDDTDSTSLMLLACQKSESSWSLVSPSNEEGDVVAVNSNSNYPVEGFVLIERSETGKIEYLQNATSWVLMVIEQYVTKGITPEVLITEAEQAEEWRQSLTLKSQDVVRRSLEVETRRDQIQELEKGLEEKRTKLDQKEDEIGVLQQSLEQTQSNLDEQQALFIAERQQLEMDQQSLQAQQKEWYRKQESLQKEVERLESLRRQLDAEPNDHQNILELK